MVDVITSDKTISAPQFLPYQKAWMNDESPRKIVDKARRTGFTFVEAYDAVSRRFRSELPRNQDYWFASADESSAYEFIEYCRFFAHNLFGSIEKHLTHQVEDPENKRTATAYVIRCPNDRRITAMTSNPRRFRSKGGDVGLDEFAFHDDQRMMYSSAEPCTRWGGTLRILSTPNGEDTEYNKLVDRCRKVLVAAGYDPDNPPQDVAYDQLLVKARELKKTPYFSYHKVTIITAIEQGLVEKINATKHTEWTREGFLQDCRDAALDDEAFAQEYLCQPGQGSKVWLSYSLIESAEHESCAAENAGLVGYTGGTCFAGVDVGAEQDPTSIWLDEMVGDVSWTRLLSKFQKTSIPEQFEIICSILQQLRWGKLAIDKTGIGLGLYQLLVKKFGESRIEGVQFNQPEMHAMAVGIKQAFEDRSERIPADNSEIRDDLHSVRQEVSASGKISYVAPRGKSGHADRFWAKCLAIRARGMGAAGTIRPEDVHSATVTRAAVGRREPSAEAKFFDANLARQNTNRTRGGRSVMV